MKQISIITAVLSNLNQIGSDVFSIYNLTQGIREDVNQGLYELLESGREVLHDEVKLAFIELVENVYGMKYQTRDSGRGYREFQRVSVDLTTCTPIVPSTVISASQVSTCNPPQCTPTCATNVACKNSIQGDVAKTILNYLAVNGTRTMKQIQSRLKNHSYTCEQIRDFLAGYKLLDENTTAFSPSKVSTK